MPAERRERERQGWEGREGDEEREDVNEREWRRERERLETLRTSLC